MLMANRINIVQVLEIPVRSETDFATTLPCTLCCAVWKGAPKVVADAGLLVPSSRTRHVAETLIHEPHIYPNFSQSKHSNSCSRELPPKTGPPKISTVPHEKK